MSKGFETQKPLKSQALDQTAVHQNSQPSGISRTDVPWQDQYRSTLRNSSRDIISQTSQIRRTEGRGAFRFLQRHNSVEAKVPSELQVIPSDPSIVFSNIAKKEPSPKHSAYVEKRYEIVIEQQARMRRSSYTSKEDENIFDNNSDDEKLKEFKIGNTGTRDRYSKNEDPRRTEFASENRLSVKDPREMHFANENRLSVKDAREVRFANELLMSNVHPIKEIESPCNIDASDESESESDDDFNMFDRKPKQSVLRSVFGAPSYTLENILNASDIYKDYLSKSKTLAKSIRFSINWRFNSSKYRNPIIPPDYFFKPVRVQFKKPDDYMAEESGSRNNSLCYVNKERTRLYYWRGDQEMGTRDAKCGSLKLRPELVIGYGTDYDPLNRRFYLFSNAQQRIIVVSETSLEKLGEVSVQKNVKDPNIHCYHMKGRSFLLILGGYVTHQKQTAQGNQYIEIFEMYAWEIGLQSKLVRLIIGRINPIVMMVGQGDARRILILGGNNVGLIDGNDIDYTYQKEINESTNMSGVTFNGEELMHLFDHDLMLTTQNLSVKIDHPSVLHSGAVIIVDRKCSLLVLPRRNCLFQLKVFQKEVNLIEGRSSMNLKLPAYQKRQIALRVDPGGSQSIVTHFIDNEGYLRRRSEIETTAQKWNCAIY